MLQSFVEAALSGVIVAAVSGIARRSPGCGALVASLPVVSVFGMLRLWRDTHDPARLADHAGATLWCAPPSLPMFALMPRLITHGIDLRIALPAGRALTIALLGLFTLLAGRLGITLRARSPRQAAQTDKPTAQLAGCLGRLRDARGRRHRLAADRTRRPPEATEPTSPVCERSPAVRPRARSASTSFGAG